jgi:hypothetical protein
MYCSIEDAFPTIDTGSLGNGNGGGIPKVGCTDPKPTKEERRAARKKAKRCKVPADLDYLALQEDGIQAAAEVATEPLGPDPDRPAVVKMTGVPPFQVGGAAEGFKLPVLPKASCTFTDPGYPDYFGSGVDSDSEEGFSTFTNVIGDDPNYRLEGAAPPPDPKLELPIDTNSVLPVPSVVDTWKPLTPAGASTAFFKYLPPPGGQRPEPVDEERAEERDEVPPVVKPAGASERDSAMQAKLTELIGRIEQIEQKRAETSQTELLLFVGTGLVLLGVLEYAGRG